MKPLRGLLLITVVALTTSLAMAANLDESLQALNAVGNNGQGHAQAMLAWRAVGSAPIESLPTLLKAIDDSKAIAANWIRAAVDQIAERALENGRKLPVKELEQIVFDEAYAPRARRLAYEWLVRVDPTASGRIVPQMLNSSSLEMRRDAVALAIARATDTDDPKASAEQFRIALTAARDTDQIDEAYEKLVSLGVEVNLPRHFGFITQWQLVGPFDNTDSKGFDTAYPPEQRISLEASYPGKQGEVRWSAYDTADKYGMVDLNTAIGKHMGAAAYAFTEFTSPEETDVDLRLGSICAAKVWLNGKLMISREVYHSGTEIDQYVARGRMQKGKNALLLKICQNEQTEAWAQDWQFQFRVCDQLGTAILSAGR